MVDPSLFTLPYDRALISALGRAGHDVTLFGRRPGPDDNGAEGISLAPHFYRVSESQAARRLPTPVRLGLKGFDHAASMLLLLRRLRRERPDVIHFQWLPLPLVDGRLLRLFRKIAPLVLTVHDTNPFNGDPSASLQQRGFFRSLNEFDRLIVHTAQGRERLCSAGVPANRVLVLPHGMLLDPPPYVDDPMTGSVTFLLFGKVKPYKGLDLLIEAFASLDTLLRRDARIWVVGKPYMDMAPLKALAERLGVADQLVIEPRFVGDDEVAGLFAPGTVAVFPYREIEASGVLSIALACGRPVIASNLGNFAETITDGVQGHLVPPGDVPALAAAMAHVLSDRDFAASCSRQARALVDAVPSWDGIAALTADAYRSAA
ncbi:MAG: glycosyltransferase family 4 protein [Janthinobacterium lividum]